jgi:ATP-dependent protease HslVU (ClpYQ) peptidase subunit
METLEQKAERMADQLADAVFREVDGSSVTAFTLMRLIADRLEEHMDGIQSAVEDSERS